MLVLAPWLFGTTQPSTILLMNLLGWSAGFLTSVKWLIRITTGFCPPRWDRDRRDNPNSNFCVAALGWLSLIVLAFMLTSLLNARATWNAASQSLTYHDSYIPWLPHSMEHQSTLNLLLNYSALAAFFWSLWDWLCGLSIKEQRESRAREITERKPAQLSARLSVLLMALCINGGCLAVEGIVQRLTNTDRLLWLVQPTVFKSAEAHFGPYAYRANGAQYLNLIWPMALGFWWMLHRRATPRRWAHHLILPAIAVMAASPFIATTRAGAIISGLLMILCILFLIGSAVLWPHSREGSWQKSVVTGLAIAAVFAGSFWMAKSWGGDALERRMIELDSGLAGRENLNAVGRKIAQDYRWFGTGPGTLVAVYPLYREDSEDYWPAQLHNDWLETRITFGRIGTAMILAALGLVLARWWRADPGIYAHRNLVGFMWIALGGLLLHARFDFPLQIYSILMTALAICAALLTFTSRRN